MRSIRKFFGNTSGATAIEYGLIAALVAVASIGALSLMGGSLETMFESLFNNDLSGIEEPPPKSK